MGLLSEERLAEQAGASRPGLFAGIARDRIDALAGRSADALGAWWDAAA